MVTNAAVASPDRRASEAGAAILERGGSVVDAAIATSAVLTVTTPHNCGVGGDLVAVLGGPDGAIDTLIAAGRAPAAAGPAMAGGSVEPIAVTGDVRAITAPGCIDGWLALHERGGRLPLDDVLAPAVELAEQGFEASSLLAMMAPLVAGRPGTEFLGPPGTLAPGDVVRRTGLATLLRLVVVEGRDGMYGGPVAAEIAAVTDGWLTGRDLVSGCAEWRRPATVDAGGVRLHTPPPPSQGYLTLAGWWIADGVGLPDDPRDPRWIHLLVESATVAGYDRPDVLHDGADGQSLVDPSRLEPRRAAVLPGRRAGLPVTGGLGDTIHLSVAGPDGAVALTQSNASGFGSGFFLPSYGVGLHSRGLGFSTTAGHPAALGPGRRPPHTLSPLVATDAGGIAVVAGSMGGDSQPQILLQVLSRIVRHDETPQDAVSAARAVLAGGPALGGFGAWVDPGSQRVMVEGHAPRGWAPGLAQRGHRVEIGRRFDHGAGHANVVVRTESAAAVDVSWTPGADPRPPESGGVVAMAPSRSTED